MLRRLAKQVDEFRHELQVLPVLRLLFQKFETVAQQTHERRNELLIFCVPRGVHARRRAFPCQSLCARRLSRLLCLSDALLLRRSDAEVGQDRASGVDRPSTSDYAVVAVFKPCCTARFMLYQLDVMNLGQLSWSLDALDKGFQRSFETTLWFHFRSAGEVVVSDARPCVELLFRHSALALRHIGSRCL